MWTLIDIGIELMGKLNLSTLNRITVGEETCKMGIYHQLDAGEICRYLVQYIRLQCIVSASFQLLLGSYFVWGAGDMLIPTDSWNQWAKLTFFLFCLWPYFSRLCNIRVLIVTRSHIKVLNWWILWFIDFSKWSDKTAPKYVFV